jgi:hypothetical protein
MKLVPQTLPFTLSLNLFGANLKKKILMHQETQGLSFRVWGGSSRYWEPLVLYLTPKLGHPKKAQESYYLKALTAMGCMPFLYAV